MVVSFSFFPWFLNDIAGKKWVSSRSILILQIDLAADSMGKQQVRDRVGYLDIVFGSCINGFASVGNGKKRVDFVYRI